MPAEHLELKIFLVDLLSLLELTGYLHPQYKLRGSVHILKVLIKYACEVLNPRRPWQIEYYGVDTQVHCEVYLLGYDGFGAQTDVLIGRVALCEVRVYLG